MSYVSEWDVKAHFNRSTIYIAPLPEGAPWRSRLSCEHDTLRLLRPHAGTQPIRPTCTSEEDNWRQFNDKKSSCWIQPWVPPKSHTLSPCWYCGWNQWLYTFATIKMVADDFWISKFVEPFEERKWFQASHLRPSKMIYDLTFTQSPPALNAFSPEPITGFQRQSELSIWLSIWITNLNYQSGYQSELPIWIINLVINLNYQSELSIWLSIWIINLNYQSELSIWLSIWIINLNYQSGYQSELSIWLPIWIINLVINLNYQSELSIWLSIWIINLVINLNYQSGYQSELSIWLS